MFNYIPIAVRCLREAFRMFQAAGPGHAKYTRQGCVFCPLQICTVLLQYTCS
jgi:hypothetical protein